MVFYIMGAPLNDVLYKGAPLNGVIYKGAPLNGVLYEGAPLNDVLYKGAPLNGVLYNDALLNGVLYTGAPLRMPAAPFSPFAVGLRGGGDEGPPARLHEDEREVEEVEVRGEHHLPEVPAAAPRGSGGYVSTIKWCFI